MRYGIRPMSNPSLKRTGHDMEIREERVTVMPDLPCTTSPVGPSDNGDIAEEMVRADVGFEPIYARGYGYTVTLCDGVVTIERGGIVASMYGFARTEIPVGSIVDVAPGKATVFANGLFCLSVRTLDGDTPMLGSASESRKSPYCAIYTKKQEKDFRRLYDAVESMLSVDPLPVAYDQTPESLYMRQLASIAESKQHRKEMGSK